MGAGVPVDASGGSSSSNVVLPEPNWSANWEDPGLFRPFPQKWATVALAYSKEMDYIQNKRQEAVKRVPNNPPPVGAVPKPKGKNAKKGGGSPQNEEVGG